MIVRIEGIEIISCPYRLILLPVFPLRDAYKQLPIPSFENREDSIGERTELIESRVKKEKGKAIPRTCVHCYCGDLEIFSPYFC